MALVYSLLVEVLVFSPLTMVPSPVAMVALVPSPPATVTLVPSPLVMVVLAPSLVAMVLPPSCSCHSPLLLGEAWREVWDCETRDDQL